MSKHPPTYNKAEKQMLRTMDNLKIYDELMPLIREVIKAGGGAENILRKSEVYAAAQLVDSLGSEKDDVKLKASIEILNRTSGKPVERTLNIYGDLAKMNEKDIDNQILRAIEKSGASQLIDTALHAKQITTSKVKQTRKPRKSDPIGQEPPQNPT